jgi:L-ascorbate metabolism protein UlaG (beta-lactamase superfamily)
VTTAQRAPSLAGLDELRLADGQVALWWLGQAGFALRAGGDPGGATVLLDPFLSPKPERLVPPPFAPDQAVGVRAVLCSHEHWDHLDADSLAALAAASPDAAVVVPSPLVPMVAALGVAPERVVGAQPGEPIELDGVTVHPVPACHGVDMADAYTFGRELSGGLYRYLGFVVEAGGVRVYHAGDTITYDGMAGWLEPLAPDVALLPINGRDRQREAHNIVGNMDHRDAAALAAALGVELLVPMHHDMFAGNLGFPAHLVDVVGREYPELPVLVPGRAQPFVHARRTRRSGPGPGRAT